ncbi:hypothetical protein ACIBVL_17240 [Streptomyces sp. NPDC049687]|uniref:hypothetical protein n=1 Tax=Streptomyces sp. NPDC049687 TaxID=3365596 RepID=UPI0037AD4372
MSTDTLPELRTGATTDTKTEGWGIASSSVVLLALGVLLAYGFDVVEDRHAQAELAACRDLVNGWAMYATAYAGLFATLAAVALAGRRLLRPRHPRGPVQMAGMVLPAALLLLVLQGLILWSLYQPSPDGPFDCLG